MDSKGVARIDISVPAIDAPQQLRVLVGPKLKENVTIREVLRLGGELVFVPIEPQLKEKEIVIQVIPNQVLCWLLSLCSVQGQVMKKVVSGGMTLDLPVCDAIVEIYEVDPIFVLIPKLPDMVIEDIRRFIVKPPWPPPPPELEYQREFTIGPVPPQPLKIGNKLTSQLSTDEGKVQAKMATAVYTLDRSYAEVSPSVETMLAGEDMQKLRVLANTANIEQFRQVLINYAFITKFILCRFRYIIPHMDLIATATTTRCGKFKAIFFRGCNNPDTPDLYFIVKQEIFPFLPPFTIYKPTPVVCHTYWNYKCGTPVTLNVTSSFARTCNPCQNYEGPPNWVLFQAIGNLHLNEIRGTSATLLTTKSSIGLTSGYAPFGEMLRPRIEFDDSLRDLLGVKYYRVSYRKGTSGQFKALTGQIDRHYEHKIGNAPPVQDVFNLGPKQEKSPGVALANQNLFLIRPALPPAGQWSYYDAVEDLASAKFDTVSLSPLLGAGDPWPESGIYQLKVDLFDQDGNLLDIDTLNIKFCVPESVDSSGTVKMRDASDIVYSYDENNLFTGLVQDDDGDGKKSLIIALHIDNSRCKAEILAPTLNGFAAPIECGVMRYEPGNKQNPDPQGSVAMAYNPIHPRGVPLQPDSTGDIGFATYTFEVLRGGGINILTEGNGVEVPYPPEVLTATKTVKDLLATCDIAGFAEHLHVWAKATSGWRRLWEYDAEKVTAFALAPETKTPGPPSP